MKSEVKLTSKNIDDYLNTSLVKIGEIIRGICEKKGYKQEKLLVKKLLLNFVFVLCYFFFQRIFRSIIAYSIFSFIIYKSRYIPI
jgi:hypothetical protein